MNVRKGRDTVEGEEWKQPFEAASAMWGKARRTPGFQEDHGMHS